MADNGEKFTGSLAGWVCILMMGVVLAGLVVVLLVGLGVIK